MTDNGAALDRKAVAVSGGIKASPVVKAEGRYTLWIRAAQTKGVRTALKGEVFAQGVRKLSATFNQGSGGTGLGGPAGFEAYKKVAMKTTPEGKTEEGGLGVAAGGRKEDEGAEIGEDELLDALGEGGKGKRTWANLMRIENPLPARPFYWWKLGTVVLEPGKHELRVRPLTRPPDEHPPLIDVAFLTTFDKLEYPFIGDIDAARASYIRFRIGGLPEKGLTIAASMRVHYDPWGTGRVWLNPNGMGIKAAEPHTQPGFTRWYRLQDIEKAPGLGRGESHLLLNIGGENVVLNGATQFAVYPHQDQVLREIRWDEPEGLRISMATDFENYLHELRTFRDHARENYEKALRATGGRVFPLTRGPLYFGNAWGAAVDAPHEYMVKSLRLLGINCAGVPHDAVRARRNYGWSLGGGHYWPPSFMPFDEEDARKKYDAHYAHSFDRQREMYEGMSIFQIADEPGEIARSEMTSPLWRYVETEAGGKWEDPCGGSDLNSRTDLHDCVLEGKVEKHGQNFTFRAGIDNAEKPAKFVYWAIGKVAWTLTVNLAFGRQGYEAAGGGSRAQAGAHVAATPTPFKIVSEGGRAALYLNGKLMHQHDGLPERGGFGFSGPAKAIAELRFRPIRKDEHISSQSAEKVAAALDTETGDEEGLTTEDIDLGEAEQEKPEWLEPLPLQEMVEKHWVVSGGMPEAHQAFRRWAASQGLKPAFFGRQSWQDVQLLTLPSLVENTNDAKLFYWSRRYSGYLTPRMFKLAADAIAKAAPNPKMLGFVALSGHALYFPSAQPLDMFRLGAEGYPLMPGVSDWMSSHGWRWDSHQAVAFSVAPYNAGARRYGGSPVSYPMMHCVWPSDFRAYTMLANDVKYISFYNYGPSYMVTEGYWSPSEWCYHSVQRTANRAAQVDDILSPGRARPCRVAMLYAMSTEYWNAQTSFADKRAAFLGLSHEYFQPELVTEDQVNDGALAHYDALFVLDRWVATQTQEKIAEWLEAGGLLWACTDALTRNEYDEPLDLLPEIAGLTRSYQEKEAKTDWPVVSPIEGEASFRRHTAYPVGVPDAVEAPEARVRARYGDGRPAWLEKPVGQGKVVYLGHRCGLTYTYKAIRLGGHRVLWGDTGRASLVQPLLEAGIEREVYLSQPLVVAAPISTEDGTVIVLYNMQANPLRAVEVTLREPRKPHSVEAFDGMDLESLPFEFRDGRIRMTLDELGTGQMIVVRREPAPPDDRREQIRTRTAAMLSSSEWQAVSAGAWTAGFFPEWELADKLTPLLAHQRWEVRRVMAESLGRLRHREAADSLLAAIQKETDAHALGDEILALGQTGDPRAQDVCVKHLSHSNWFVRRQSLLGAEALLRGGGELAEAVNIALGDPDLRVREQAIRLLGHLDANQTLSETVAIYSGEGRHHQEKPHWLSALCKNDPAFEAYLGKGLPGGEELFLAVAGRRASPPIAARLLSLAEKKQFHSDHAFFSAAVTQRDKALTKRLFEMRNDLPKYTRNHLVKLLEVTFNARLGNVLSDWEEWLAGGNDE